MPLPAERLSLPDVVLVTPPRLADGRGYFVETYTRRKFVEIGIDVTFVQDNQSLSTQRGTIRGLHFQLAPEPQAKLVRAITGSVFDVAVDLREGSPTYGRWCGATLTAARGEQLFIPQGFAHAFCTLEPDTLVAYKVDGYYNKAAEGGVRWDDPDIAIDWPLPKADIVVSEKDAALPSLREAATPFRFGG
jgi:dTDP-4-dehydrorhamnose 3,5-epimerase